MSYEEGTNETPCPGVPPALVTPPKDSAKEQTLANPAPPLPLIHGSFGAPFSPIQSDGDFEPLPFRVGQSIFDQTCSPSTVPGYFWQLTYSPLIAPTSSHGEAESEDGEHLKLDSNHVSPDEGLLLAPRYGPRPEDAKSSDVKPQPDDTKSRDTEAQPKEKANDGSEGRPPPYHHSPWNMYPPHPYYWHHGYYHYPGYNNHHFGAPSAGGQQRSAPHPNLYPRPPGGHYHAYHPPAPYGKHPPRHYPHPTEAQEYIEATKNDVICGRGGAVNNHPGNRRFRSFIQEYKHQYLNETKQKKPFVAIRVLEAVRSSDPPGRFLVKHLEGYLECDEDRAREKASQALREGAAKLRKEGSKRTQNESGDKRGFQPTRVLLPNEREPIYDPHYPSEFDPPRKKIKQEEAV